MGHPLVPGGITVRAWRTRRRRKPRERKSGASCTYKHCGRFFYNHIGRNNSVLSVRPRKNIAQSRTLIAVISVKVLPGGGGEKYEPLSCEIYVNEKMDTVQIIMKILYYKFKILRFFVTLVAGKKDLLK